MCVCFVNYKNIYSLFFSQTNQRQCGINKSSKSAASEHIEISMLPEAPKPPGSGFSKKKKSSRHKTAKGMTNHALAVPNEQENYEDMSGKQIEQENYAAFDPDEEPQEDYANYQRNQNEEMPQDDYENLGINPSNANAHIDEDKQEDYENVQNALSKANMDDTEEQEDYENYTGGLVVPPQTNMTFDNDEGPSEIYENFNTENPYMNVEFGKY